ncbi:DUF6221 family protein [Streptomyces sp. NPDC050085]|uniref:DUF6221 family protein n=1 Tax=Streptomyces sp. NPDC050085 TaxID=3365600 RepID=UPI00378AA0F2
MPQMSADRAEFSASELVAFLRARVQDDLDHARDAMVEDGEWRAERTVVVLDTGAEIPEVYLGPADHIARFDPARIVREVEARRALLDLYEAAQAAGMAVGYRDGLRQALAMLASVYADHADYREHWRP